MNTGILGRLQEEEGQGLVEYALILVLIAAVVVAGLTAFGGGVASAYQTIVAAF